MKNKITAAMNQISAAICFLSVFFFLENPAAAPLIKAIAIAVQVQNDREPPLS
ncbi:hypothetical protein ACQCVK_03385 [Rossellomorea vietnamensis]|uniref:hypothetical protein n=1 Tax=Rossellomorea vietnamensis TaxID=218284 RepID=UPI003CEFB4F1